MAKDLPVLSPLPGLNSRSNLVADAIRDAILKGVFPPGSELARGAIDGGEYAEPALANRRFHRLLYSQ
jgi:hypothetical protein